MNPTPEPHPDRPAPSVLTRRGVVRTAVWSVPAITVASAAPAYADSSGAAVTATRFVGFEAFPYRWPDMQWVEAEQPWIDAAIDYFIEPDEPGPSPAVIVSVTFPDSWTAGGTRDVAITYGGDLTDFGNWTPSATPVDGTILTKSSISFVHSAGLPLGDFNPHIDALYFTAFVPGVDLSTTTDPIALTYAFVDQGAADSGSWGIAASSSAAIVHSDGNWIK